MTREHWVKGDRVKMRDPNGYTFALRKLGDRAATVENVFTPAGSSREVVRVRFDVRRKGTSSVVEFFSHADLVTAEPSPRQPVPGEDGDSRSNELKS